MHFWLNRQEMFCATINSNNSAHLDGCTALISESAHLTNTLPLDLTLWHCRFAHHNYADVKKMINKKLVVGLDLNSAVKPDPVCEPCLAGKMRSNPFPPSSSHASKPLELIHSDIHGPLPVCAIVDYRYWITFIDDCTSFKAAMALKRKSDAFNAFKTFKAYAENALDAKIKALQDDKGGEYMSKEFIVFTDACGIEQRHTTRNRPQQNGVAERANRILSEDITAMLNESGLPASFWAHCLHAQIHILNRIPTAAQLMQSICLCTKGQA